MGFSFRDMYAHKTVMVKEADALPGRAEPMEISGIHYIFKNSIVEPYDSKYEVAFFALGCFWGAEKLFWNIDGVYTTAVGYQGGYTPHPTWEETISALTGHTETVKVVFDPFVISYEQLVVKYFEGHNPTEFMGQGNDIGTEYRSAIFTTSHGQYETALKIKKSYNETLIQNGYDEITTEVHDVPTQPFYYAEEFHQQYLQKIQMDIVC